MKRCKGCDAWKPLTAFYVNKTCKDGYMGKCRDCLNAYGAQYFREHREAIMAKKPERDHRYTWKLRQRVFMQYGQQCVCCGETSLYFLQMTHPAGRSAPHLEEIGDRGGNDVCWYLQRHGFPQDYRLLCGNCARAYGSFRFCPHHGSDPRDMTSTGMQYRWNLRLEILAAYGDHCACCDEVNPYFLEIDHPNGDGGQHRKAIGISAGQEFYRYLKREGFPQGYRLLCSNCNTARGWYGFCPHKEEIPEQWKLLA